MDPLLFYHYHSFLDEVLTPRRLDHSLGVMQVMEELAAVYGLDREKAVTAGLLHDAAKDLPADEQQQLSEEGGLGLETFGDLDYSLYYHGPVGAVLVRKALGIEDPVILEAIAMHGFCGGGAGFHSPFVWCLRFADLLEPNRSLSDPRWEVERRWYAEGKAELWRLIRDGKLREAARSQTEWLIKMFVEKGLPVHPNMHRAYQELSSADSLLLR